MASETVAMVLAVNCAPQAPADGQATCSSSSRSSAVILPTENWPTASNKSCTVTGGQRGLHALMPHGDAVGDGDGAEFAGRASGCRNALLHGLRLAHQRDVARG